jgi:hypothetical protein
LLYATQVRATQVRVTQVPTQLRATQVRVTQVRVTQVPTQLRVTQVRAKQVRVTQVRATFERFLDRKPELGAVATPSDIRAQFARKLNSSRPAVFDFEDHHSIL